MLLVSKLFKVNSHFLICFKNSGCWNFLLVFGRHIATKWLALPPSCHVILLYIQPVMNESLKLSGAVSYPVTTAYAINKIKPKLQCWTLIKNNCILNKLK